VTFSFPAGLARTAEASTIASICSNMDIKPKHECAVFFSHQSLCCLLLFLFVFLKSSQCVCTMFYFCLNDLSGPNFPSKEVHSELERACHQDQSH
jgi:hypothetical protein